MEIPEIRKSRCPNYNRSGGGCTFNKRLLKGGEKTDSGIITAK